MQAIKVSALIQELVLLITVLMARKISEFIPMPNLSFEARPFLRYPFPPFQF